ncbi:MAG: GPR endopeptidase [Ruminococcaceae bacterium]|nr:GPR endopeptidase [Oscillospiraceae bacterium]
MQARTDLAIEATPGRVTANGEEVSLSEAIYGRLRISRLQVRSERAARQMGKPRGRYVTAQFPPLSDDEKGLANYAEHIGNELQSLLPTTGTVLVVGLGNRTVTPDTLGPATADMVLATRHIRGEFARTVGLQDLRPTAVLTPGVLGQTGTESGEIVRGVCREVQPAAVIVVDALAARSPDRLGCTVQLCDNGIAPGSGVGNDRQPLNRELLGVPVIGLGVPTVVDAAALVEAYLPGTRPTADFPPMMVTPREIDLTVSRAARLLAMSIHRALQPGYSPTDLISVASR